MVSTEEKKKQVQTTNNRRVYLFCDEFTNFNDTEIGIKAILIAGAIGL